MSDPLGSRMTPYQVRKCMAHSQGGCWIVRRWSPTTYTYQFASAQATFADAIGVLR